MNFRGVPIDRETIPRSLRRKVSPKKPYSSYPLLSGDTFRTFCDYELQKEDVLAFTNKKKILASKNFIFAGAKPQHDSIFKLADLLTFEKSPMFPSTKLLIHNGDEVPNDLQFDTLSKHFLRIFSVNYLGKNPKIIALPIGLENKYHFRNGVPKDYLASSNQSLSHQKTRDIDFLFAFSFHTNPEGRLEALKVANRLPNSLVIKSHLTPRQYRKLLERSRFVISPPGNGADCHRTWEALYLGATPIVLKSFWPFEEFNLPVIVLESWEDLTSIPVLQSNFGFPWNSISAWLEINSRQPYAS